MESEKNPVCSHSHIRLSRAGYYFLKSCHLLLKCLSLCRQKQNENEVIIGTDMLPIRFLIILSCFSSLPFLSLVRIITSKHLRTHTYLFYFIYQIIPISMFPISSSIKAENVWTNLISS